MGLQKNPTHAMKLIDALNRHAVGLQKGVLDAVELGEIVAVNGPAEVCHDALVIHDWAGAGKRSTGRWISDEYGLLCQCVQCVLEGRIRLRTVCLP